MCCGSGGERNTRHNNLRDALFDTAVAAGLGPVREGRFLLPGNDRRPADVLIRNWLGGKDAALDVTVVTPLQEATMPAAAHTAGHALNHAHGQKLNGAHEECRSQGIAFLPIVAETFGGWHPEAGGEVKKLGAALARHTGQEEGEAVSHPNYYSFYLLLKTIPSLQQFTHNVFCREAIFVANLRTLECKIFRPENV